MTVSRVSATTAVALLLAIGAASCGDDGTTSTQSSPTTTAVTSATTAPPTTAPPSTAPPSTAPPSAETGSAFVDGTPEAAVATAYRTVFDSSLGFADKAMYLEDAEALEATTVAYSEGGKSFGGFKLEPTAVTITGDAAEVTYDVYFGTNPQYTDQQGGAVLVNGVWTVERSEFCSFMASARTPCPA